MFIKPRLKYFSSQKSQKGLDKHIVFPIEYVHLATGYILILSGAVSMISQGIEMFLAWAIFGCMYISMSDIGECSKCKSELCSVRHKNRRLKAYMGMFLSCILLGFYIVSTFVS